MSERPDRVDLLIRHGHVLPMDTPEGTSGANGKGTDTGFPDGVVAVRDGRVEFVGDDSLAEEVSAAETVDAHGCAVLPGFVNAHTHLPMTLFRGLGDELDLDRFVAVTTAEEARTLTPRTVELGTAKAAEESLLAGTVAALDMYWFPGHVRSAARALGLRVVNGPTFAGFPTADGKSFAERIDEAEAELSGCPPGSPDAPVVMPHSTYALDPGQLRTVAALAERHRARVHTHASESRQEVAGVRSRHGVSPIRLLHDVGLLHERTVVAHAVHLDTADIGLLASSGAAVAHCPWSNLKLGAGVAPVTALRAAGVRVALGTDGAVSSNSLDMWSVVRLAASLHKGREEDPTAVTAREALEMATVAGGVALGLPGVLGAIRAGAPATLQVVDIDRVHHFGQGSIWSRLAYSVTASDVRHVLVDGAPRVRDHRLVRP
ncbi:amidohydrolase family protein [Streptomyces sp. NPDC055078]